MEAAERFSEEFGYIGEDSPQIEKIISRKSVPHRNPNPRSKFVRRSTSHLRPILAMDLFFEGDGVDPQKVELANYSLDQILDILQASGETALYGAVEKPTGA